MSSSTSIIQVHATGLVYSNPKPYLKAIHAWHPSIVELEDGRLLCSFDLGQAAESMDYRSYLASSSDGGNTWSQPRRLLDDSNNRPATHTIRLSKMRDGTLVGIGARFYRDNPNEGLTNRETLGYVPMDLVLMRSSDAALTWTVPTTIKPPLVGPTFEVCHSVRELSDGVWLAPTQTWPAWNGEAPSGRKTIAFVSRDHGNTWPEYITLFDRSDQGVIHFEVSVVELSNGRLLAIAWAYDLNNRRTLPTPYVVSDDRQQFSAPRETGLRGQTAKLLTLDDDHFICVYRRDDKPGLWLQLSRLDSHEWVNIAEMSLWSGPGSASTNLGTISDELSSLQFGYPSLLRLANSEIIIVFWCQENGIGCIRYFRLSISPVVMQSHGS
jgi:sialidase-1